MNQRNSPLGAYNTLIHHQCFFGFLLDDPQKFKVVKIDHFKSFKTPSALALIP